MEKCKCGNESMHEQWRGGVPEYFCCSCWVKDGNAPADFHSECMKAYSPERAID